MAAGQQLRSLRERRRLRVRDVEEASRRIADAKGDEKCRLTNGWLVRLEKCDSAPNLHHLFVLCATYGVDVFEFLRLYGINIEELPKYEAIANSQQTQLLSPTVISLDLTAPRTTRLALDVAAKLPLRLPFEHSDGQSPIRYAQLGANEVTMCPLIKPGSIVVFDTSQTRIETGDWPNDFERPIYVVELRDRVTCGWCERRENKLLVVNFRSSSFQEFKPQDALILGRVVAYYTPCVDMKREATPRGLEAKGVQPR